MIKQETKYIDTETGIGMTIKNGRITFWNSKSKNNINAFTFIGSHPNVVKKVLKSLKSLTDSADQDDDCLW